jgi:hypothetical protein
LLLSINFGGVRPSALRTARDRDLEATAVDRESHRTVLAAVRDLEFDAGELELARHSLEKNVAMLRHWCAPSHRRRCGRAEVDDRRVRKFVPTGDIDRRAAALDLRPASGRALGLGLAFIEGGYGARLPGGQLGV